MNDQFHQPTEHERRVAEEERDQGSADASPNPAGSQNRVTGDAEAPDYETEIEAERTGTTAEQVEERDEEDRGPLDASYRPRSG